MRIAITGSTGLVGSELVSRLKEKGHDVYRMVRRFPPPHSTDIYWNPDLGKIDVSALEGMDAVIHLAGVNVAEARWSKTQKERIWKSRVVTTHFLCKALAGLAAPPRLLIQTSATGYYGDRGDEICTEESTQGKNFLADLCHEWERAGEVAKQKGIRVIVVRMGMVLSRQGGALRKMLRPFRLGLGGVMGSGQQWMSWILLSDLVSVFDFLLSHPLIAGFINAVTPHPVKNREFTKILGHVLQRPTLLPLPAFAVRMLFGEMGERLLLEGCRVMPQKLSEAGFGFENPFLEEALRKELGVC